MISRHPVESEAALSCRQHTIDGFSLFDRKIVIKRKESFLEAIIIIEIREVGAIAHLPCLYVSCMTAGYVSVLSSCLDPTTAHGLNQMQTKQHPQLRFRK